MTNEELDAIYERVNGASTGPWTIEANAYTGENWPIGTVCVWLGRSALDDQSYTVTTDRVRASELSGDARTDAEFIAHARTDIPALLAEVGRLRNLLPASTEDLPPLSAQYMYTSKAPPVEADEYERLRAALVAATQRAEAAEAVAGNMLNHLLPDTIRAIVLDLSAAEHDAPDSGEFALLPQTLEFRDKCAAFLGAEWPSSAWDQEWCTALEAERSRRAHALAQSEAQA